MTTTFDPAAAMEIVNADVPGAACVDEGVLFIERNAWSTPSSRCATRSKATWSSSSPDRRRSRTSLRRGAPPAVTWT